MPHLAPVIRVFFSSTFADFQTERDALQARVFPALRRYCLERGARFLPIDLRWGISESASADQYVVRACLEEIGRCQRISPDVNFVALLGDRYGTRMLAEAIPQMDFDLLMAHLSESARTLAQRWYRLDTNAVLAAYVLRPRGDGWEQESVMLHDALSGACDTAPVSHQTRVALTASVTEQEIDAGIYQGSPTATPLILHRRMTNAGAPDHFKEPTTLGREHLAALIANLRTAYGEHYQTYNAEVIDGHISDESIEAFCTQIQQALTQRIDRALARSAGEQADDRDALAHLAFARDRLRHFAGQQDALARIAAYLSAPAATPLLLSGVPGIGKTSLLLKAAEAALTTYTNVLHQQYFIGGSTTVSHVSDLLAGIERDLLAAYPHPNDLVVPDSFAERERQLPVFLGLATADRPLMLLVDALDQLQGDHPQSHSQDQQHLSRWIPATLPPHVHLIISMLPGADSDAIQSRLPATAQMTVRPPAVGDAMTLFGAWLRDEGRACTPDQLAAIEAYYRDHPNPLGLRVIAERARRWPSWRTELPPLQPTVPGLIGAWLGEMEEETQHGKVLPSYALGLIAAGKHGLTEDEVLAVIDQHPDLVRDMTRSYLFAPEGKHFPAVLWARLYADIEWGLTERAVDQTAVLAFYHQQVQSAIESRYLSGDTNSARHRDLAHYFSRVSGQAPYLVNTTERPRGIVNERMVSELAFQQAAGQLWDELHATLFDAEFLQARIQAGSTQAAVDDLSYLTNEDSSPQMLKQALELSRHILDSAPQELPNQLRVRAPSVYPLLHDWPMWPDPHFALTSQTLDKAGGDLLRIMPHNTYTGACVFSPDGRYVLSVPQDHTIRLWDVQTGEERLAFQKTPGSISACIFSPDGRYVLSVGGTSASTVEVWDIQTGTVVRTFQGPTETRQGYPNWIHAFAFSPDGRYVLSGARDGILRLWSVETGELVATLLGHFAEIKTCMFSPDGAQILSASEDHVLRLWDISHIEQRRTAHSHAVQGRRSAMGALAFSLDGRYALSASSDAESWNASILVWDVQNEKRRPLYTLQVQNGLIHTCVFSPDGRYILGTLSDYTIHLWETQTGKALRTFAGHTAYVNALAFSPDGNHLLSASDDFTLRLWNLQTGAPLHTFQGHTARVSACTFSPDGQYALSASNDNTQRLWNVANIERATVDQINQQSTTIQGHSDLIWSCAFSPDGTYALSASRDNTLRLWNVETEEPVRILQGHTKMVLTCAFSPDGKYALSGSQDSTLRLWDVTTGEQSAIFQDHTERIESCAISPNGRYIVSTSGDLRDIGVRLWDVETRELIYMYQEQSDEYASTVTACAISPDGRYVLGGKGALFSLTEKHFPLILWDAQTGDEVRAFWGHTQSINTCVFSPDSTYILSASSDMTLRLWDVQTGEELRAFWHSGEVNAGVFSPDGRFILSVSDDATLRLWDAQTGGEVARWPAESELRCLAVSRNGQRIIVGEGNNLHFLTLANV